jgi:hypothetical protein
MFSTNASSAGSCETERGGGSRGGQGVLSKYFWSLDLRISWRVRRL